MKPFADQTTLKVLKKARSLLRAKKNWTQGTLARTKTGRPCTEDSKRAVCFCSAGALIKASVEVGDISWAAHRIFASVIEDLSIPYWNDVSTRTHKEVLAAFDKAIKLAEAQCAP